MTTAITASVKTMTERDRPDISDERSFPSGHTSNSFTWATVAAHHYGWKAAIPAYAFAGYVGASRIQSRKHHLSDVLAGATLGFIVGRTVSRRYAPGGNGRVRVNVTVPPGGGAAVSVGLRLR